MRLFSVEELADSPLRLVKQELLTGTWKSCVGGMFRQSAESMNCWIASFSMAIGRARVSVQAPPAAAMAWRSTSDSAKPIAPATRFSTLATPRALAALMSGSFQVDALKV